MQKEGKNRKKISALLIAILAVLLIGILVAVGFITGIIPTGGNVDNSTLYWNIDKKQYLSDSGTSSRVQGEDGYYQIRFAADGEQVEYLVQDRELVDTIDNMELMGLVVDKQGVITEVLDPSAVTGGEMVNKWYVVSVEDGKAVVGDTLDDDGLTYNVNISEETGIYDVSGVEPVGQSTTLKRGDCVRVFKGKEGGIAYIFVVDDDKVTFKGETVERYCEHCQKDVTWNVWTEADVLPTDKGHWVLSNDVALNGVQEIETNIEVVLDLNGQKVDGRLNTQMYHVTNDGATLVIMDQSEQKTGTLAAHGFVKTGGVVNLQKGVLKIYGGTLDASDVDTDYYGCALRLQSQTTTDIYDGTIIGGITRRAKTGGGSFVGGGGGSIFVDKNAVVNMYDGTIRDGKSYTYQDPTTKNYSYGIGGNIYLATYATFNMYGGEILNGWAERDGGNVYVMGGATFTMENATISGGKAEQNRAGNLLIGNETKVEIKNSKITNGTAVHGGNIASWSKSSLTMTDCTVADGTATVRGGNIVIIGDLTLNNCTISGGKALHEKANDANGLGGNICALGFSTTVDGVKKYEKATVTLKNTTVKGGESTGNGGNITLKEYVDLVIDKSVTIADGTSKKGGNIYVARNSIIKMSGGTIKNGTATEQGGNIVMWGLSTLEISGGTISGGTAVLRGGNIVCLGDLKMTGGTIEGGKVQHEKPSNDKGIGGNIYFAGYTDSTVKEKPSYKSSLTMTGGTITGGESVNSRGGNIYIKEMANVTISDKAVIKDGVAKVNGGNIMAQKSSVTITVNKGAVIKDGTAGSCGGNLFNNGAIITFNDVDITGGTAGTSGGNIHSLNAPLTLNNVNITGGTSKSGSNIFVEGETGVLTMNGGTLTDGKGASTGANIYISKNSTAKINNAKILDGSVKSRGGNIYASGGAKLELTGNTEISGGKAGDRGGNILSYGDIAIKGNVVIKDGELDNKASLGGNIYIAVYTQTTKDESGKEVTEVVHESKMTMDGGTITNGKSVNGGNIWANATLTLKDALISNGKATAVENDTDARGIGGNILLNGRSLTLSGTTKVLNGIAESVTTEVTRGEGDDKVTELGYRTGCGGNIYSIGSITITDEAEVSGGKAIGTEKVKNNNLVLGGNIFMRGSSNTNRIALTIEGGIVKDGEAFNRGGNINLNQYVDFVLMGATDENGNVIAGEEGRDGIVTGGKITSNNGNGGNIFAQTGSTITIGNRGILSDGFTAGSGGNIMCNISGKTITLEEGSQVYGGVAAKGGNIYATNGILDMNGGVLKNGLATSGGNVYIENGDINMNGGVMTFDEDFEQNASNGGNIYFENKDKKDVAIRINGGTIASGVAKSNGGNIAAYNGSKIIMSGGTVEAGKAATAGNIHLERAGIMQMSGGEIKDGYASNRGGNLVVWGFAKFTMTGGTIKDGEAKNMGGNIFSFGDIELKDGTITNGKATAANSKGGNIYITSFSNTLVTPAETVQTSIVMTGGKVALGEAVNGGNIWANATVTISGGEVSEGKATAFDNDTQTVGCGGNIFMSGGSLNVSGTAKICDGVATSATESLTNNDGATTLGYYTGCGGNIYSAASVTVSNGAEITGGKAVGTEKVKNNNLVLGGNIYMKGASDAKRIALTITGGTISGGEAYNRGGNINLFAYTDFVLKGMTDADGNVIAGEEGRDGIVTGGKITSNNGNGGNIFAQTGSTITIGNRGILSDGFTAGSGGNVLCNISGKNITLEAGSQVFGGVAAKGGNFYITNGNLSVAGTIKNGRAANGGNIYNEKGKITVKDGANLTFDADATQIATTGGNIYICGSSTDSGELVINGGKIENGQVTSGHGGNVYLKYADFTMNGGTIQNGIAGTDGNTNSQGGNVYVDSYTTTTLNAGSIINGQATRRGGNLYLGSNQASLGSGIISITGGKIVSISGGTKTDKSVSNIFFFASSDYLKILTTLNEASRIGVNSSAAASATQNFATNATQSLEVLQTIFSSDDSAKAIYLNEDSNKLYMAEAK